MIEDTENGHRRYEDLDKLPCPVVSVARSPLKDPEDFLVGQSVVFSTEAVMRGRGDILHGRPALVIGFGKLGCSIARLLHAKGVQVTVYDIDPVRRTQALSQGFTVARDREGALSGAGLVLCATGAVSLRGEDFAHLRNGAYVATVTSSEDELDLDGLPDVYTRTTVGDHVTRYQTTGHYFYLATAATPSTSCTAPASDRSSSWSRPRSWPAIRMLARGDLDPGMHEVDRDRPRRHRRDLALLLQQVIDLPITPATSAPPSTPTSTHTPRRSPPRPVARPPRRRSRPHLPQGVPRPRHRRRHPRRPGRAHPAHPSPRPRTSGSCPAATWRPRTDPAGGRPARTGRGDRHRRRPVTPVGDRPLHIDVHPIPANDAKGEPDHQHVDFRFLFRTDAEVGALQTEEVTDAAWRTIDTLHDERLRRRVEQALR